MTIGGKRGTVGKRVSQLEERVRKDGKLEVRVGQLDETLGQSEDRVEKLRGKNK